MMDLVKLDNGAFKFVNEYFDIRMVVFKAMNIIKAQANLKRIKLVGLIENHENMHLVTNVWGDSQRYMQIIFNFLTNALKFTDDHG